MQALSVADLYSLEQYHDKRGEFRKRVLQHKNSRRLLLGQNLNLCFEDRLTIQYQVQEMLRIERIFQRESIQDELDAYNPLIPDGANLKATLMIEFPDVEERRAALTRLAGIEDRIYLQVAGMAPTYAIADEDMDRATEDKTSAVHFLRFEFDTASIQALKAGGALTIGCDHEQYRHTATVEEPVRRALLADFD